MGHLDAIRERDGKLPAYAWPGGYPVIYIMTDGDTLCAECANGEHGSLARTTNGPDDVPNDGWRIDGYSIHWEGPDEVCCHCSVAVPSAYGEGE